ncbi:hypothetical protein LguiA_001392 [Lonicera macranthoides]
MNFVGAERVVSSVVELINDLLNERGNLLTTIERIDLRTIVSILKTMKHYLSKAEAIEAVEEPEIRQLVADIKQTANDARLVIQICTRRVRALGWIGRVRRNAFNNIPIISKPYWLRDREIIGRLSEITTRLIRSVSTGEDYTSTSTFGLMRSGSFVVNEDDDFVGFEEEIELLVGKLVGDGSDTLEEVTKIVCIHGADGMGKTSIARKIYNHPRVKRHFSAFAWVNTFAKFEDEMIMRCILLSLGGPLVRRYDELVPSLTQELQRQRCLVVFDDVELDDFLDNKNLEILLTNNDDSKFLFTCTKHCRAANCFSYEAKCLNGNESWELFKRKVLHEGGTLFKRKVLHERDEHEESLKILTGEKIIVDVTKNNQKDVVEDDICHEASKDPIPEQMETLGREMIQHCNGIPLVVAVLGGLLATKPKLSYWTSVQEMVYGASTKDILRLSYQKLPNGMLKQCFVSLVNLPYKSKYFNADKLLQWWMAENVISMYVAESYLKELARRCLVEVQIDESTGRAKSFCLHKLFHDLCLELNDEPGINEVIDLRSMHPVIPSSSSSNPGKIVRRLSYYLDNLDDLDRYVQPERESALDVRSVVFYINEYNRRSRISRMVESQLGQFKMVRILDLGGLVFSKLDKAVGKLKHLNYLGLRYSVFHELPSTIGNMEHLQTLDLLGDENTQYASIIIPNVLWKMNKLKHLYLRRLVWSNKERDNKMQLSGLIGLETLANFDSRVFNVSDLFELIYLCELEAIICTKSDLAKITDYLRKALNMYRLVLSIKYCDLYSEEGKLLLEGVLTCSVLHELSVDGRMVKLPHYDPSFSECLTKITLESCELIEDPMAMLQKLPNLRSLFLKWNAFVGAQMACSAKGFPQLRILQLWRIRNLENWRVTGGAMPKLRSLDIMSCPNLKMLPEGLMFINTLKRLVIRWMPEEFTNRLLPAKDITGGEDLYKVPHASILMPDYKGKETAAQGVQENNDAVTKRESVSRKLISPSSSPPLTATKRWGRGKVKAPMTTLKVKLSMMKLCKLPLTLMKLNPTNTKTSNSRPQVARKAASTTGTIIELSSIFR